VVVAVAREPRVFAQAVTKDCRLLRPEIVVLLWEFRGAPLTSCVGRLSWIDHQKIYIPTLLAAGTTPTEFAEMSESIQEKSEK